MVGVPRKARRHVRLGREVNIYFFHVRPSHQANIHTLAELRVRTLVFGPVTEIDPARHSPGVSLGFSYMPEHVSERVRNYPPQFGHRPHALHGERLTGARLAVREYRSIISL